jgi:hypothetical protein
MSESHDHFDLDVPDALAAALGQTYRHRPDVPPRVDDAVLAVARDKFDRRRNLKLWVRWGAGLTSAAAAAILLVLWLLPTRDPSHAPRIAIRPPAMQSIKGDIDASGQLDIVDAMALARHLRANDRPDPTWDANGDATVDQRDVDALAAAAVNLKQQGLAAKRLPSFNELGLDRLPKAAPAQTDIALLNVQSEQRQ